jgi:hypothetical protein
MGLLIELTVSSGWEKSAAATAVNDGFRLISRAESFRFGGGWRLVRNERFCFGDDMAAVEAKSLVVEVGE